MKEQQHMQILYVELKYILCATDVYSTTAAKLSLEPHLQIIAVEIALCKLQQQRQIIVTVAVMS